MSRLFSYGCLATSLIALDRLTKYCAMHQYYPTSLLGITLEPSINRGLAWSMFSSNNAVVYAGVCCVAFVFFILFCLYAYKRNKEDYTIVPEIMIIAGAASNLIDRFLYQGVVDFIAIEWGIFSWPSFNIADISICLGAFFIIMSMVSEDS